MANKKEFSYLMQKICKGYMTKKQRYPSLTGISLTKNQVQAIEEVLDLEDNENLVWFNDCIKPRCKTI